MALTPQQITFINTHIPPPHNTPESYEKFIEQRLGPHKVLLTTLMQTVRSLLFPIQRRYRRRFVCRIDDSNQVKNPASIIDKILRSQKNRPNQGNASASGYTIDNFDTTMTDLVRFRIVCNFLSDVREVADIITASVTMAEYFRVEKKDSLELRPSQRKSGERSIKFILEYKKKKGLFLEVQVMTLLQEAWDKKDHFLVYERHRIEPGEDERNFPDYLDAKLFAMSELLYVADNYFDDLRNSRENEKESGNKGGSHENS